MDLERADHFASIGSFFVGLIGVALLIYQIWWLPAPAPQAPILSPTNVSPPTTAGSEEPTGHVIRRTVMEWLPVGLIAFGILGGGYFHWSAARIAARSGSRSAGSTASDDSASRRLPADRNPRQLVPETTPEIATLPPAANAAPVNLIGELEMTFQRDDHGLYAVIRNVNHATPPKRDISLEVLDIQPWSEQHRAFYDVPEVRRSPMPLPVRHSAGDAELYFDRKQRYRFFERTDNKGRINFAYPTPQNQLKTIPLAAGLWRFRLRLKWGQVSDETDFYFKWEGAGLVPEPAGDPRAA